MGGIAVGQGVGLRPSSYAGSKPCSLGRAKMKMISPSKMVTNNYSCFTSNLKQLTFFFKKNLLCINQRNTVLTSRRQLSSSKKDDNKWTENTHNQSLSYLVFLKYCLLTAPSAKCIKIYSRKNTPPIA